MGGQAFADMATDSGKSVHIPRMPSALYNNISAEYQQKLETLFERVVIPREAPAKADHGDVDFLVQGILPNTSGKDIWTAIEDMLGAELHFSRGNSHSYAVPHPTIPEAYVQIDVELSPGDGTPNSADYFEWTRFMKGDSDLLQIMGISHRPLGLTCNDQGLHVRVEEIEPYNKKKALLFLTRKPNEAMEFYGLDVNRYWSGFTDETDLFDWVSSGRFFSQSVFESRVEKSNDRSRHAKRPMYRRFIEEFMPVHPDKGVANRWTRQQVLQEALDVFRKHAEYGAMMEEHHLKEAEEDLWNDIRAILPVGGNSLGTVVRSLRRWVVFNNGEPCIAAEATLEEHPMWAEFITMDNRGRVLDWVKDHWEQVKILEKARANAVREAAKTS